MSSAVDDAAARADLVSRAALLAGAGTGAVTVVALQMQQHLPLGRGFVVRAAVMAAAVMSVALAGLGDHHPFRRIGAANLVTGTRALMVALLAAVAVDPGRAGAGWWLIATAGVAASMDLADGWLARRSGLASAFGARFDMEVDALLILVLSALVWRQDLAGPWVLASGLMRYAFIAGGWLWPWLERPLLPSRRRQTVCVIQIVALIVAMAPIVPPAAALGLAAVSLALLTWSFAMDVAWLARQRARGRSSW